MVRRGRRGRGRGPGACRRVRTSPAGGYGVGDLPADEHPGEFGQADQRGQRPVDGAVQQVPGGADAGDDHGLGLGGGQRGKRRNAADHQERNAQHRAAEAEQPGGDRHRQPHRGGHQRRQAHRTVVCVAGATFAGPDQDTGHGDRDRHQYSEPPAADHGVEQHTHRDAHHRGRREDRRDAARRGIAKLPGAGVSGGAQRTRGDVGGDGGAGHPGGGQPGEQEHPDGGQHSSRPHGGDTDPAGQPEQREQHQTERIKAHRPSLRGWAARLAAGRDGTAGGDGTAVQPGMQGEPVGPDPQ